MIVSPTLPVKNLKEFIALLKANPGKYSYASSGTGTAVHLAEELFREKAGVDIVHVPYRGTVAAMPDILTGRVAMMIDGVPVQTKNILERHGARARGDDRHALAGHPDVPTMKESGLDYVVPFWTAIYAPAHTPKPIVEKLAAAIAKAMKSDEVSQAACGRRHRGRRLNAGRARRADRQQFALYRGVVEKNPALVKGQ